MSLNLCPSSDDAVVQGLCFEDLVLMSAVSLTFLVLSGRRIMQLRKHRAFWLRHTREYSMRDDANSDSENAEFVALISDDAGAERGRKNRGKHGKHGKHGDGKKRHARELRLRRTPQLQPDNKYKLGLSVLLTLLELATVVALALDPQSAATAAQVASSAFGLLAWIMVTVVLFMERPPPSQSYADGFAGPCSLTAASTWRCGFIHRGSWMVRFLFSFSLVGRALKFSSMIALFAQGTVAGAESYLYFFGLGICLILALLALFHPAEQRDYARGKFTHDEVSVAMREHVRRREHKAKMRKLRQLRARRAQSRGEKTESHDLSDDSDSLSFSDEDIYIDSSGGEDYQSSGDDEGVGEGDTDGLLGAGTSIVGKDGLVNGRPRYPQETANILSKLVFWWVNSMLALGRKRPLEEEDIWALPASDRTDLIARKFNRAWLEERRKGNDASLLKALFRAFGKPFAFSGLLKLINDGAQFVGPVLLKSLIDWLSDDGGDPMLGWYLVFAIFLGQIVGAIAEAHYFDVVTRTGMYVRGSLINAVFEKSLVLSSRARQRQSTGTITNLMSSDTEQMQQIVQNLHILWSSPGRIIIALVLLINELGWAALAGVFTLIVMIPLQAKIVGRIGGFRRSALGQQDQRLKFMNEIVNGIRVLKFYAWENQFLQNVLDVRGKEWGFLKSQMFTGAFNSMLINLGPILVTIASFSIFVLAGGDLTPAVAFTSLSLFNVLRIPLVFFPQVVTGMVQARVSLRRMQEFLLSDEVQASDDLGDASTDAVVLENSDFAWGEVESSAGSDEPGFSLIDVNVRIPKGGLTMIVGPTGSGKSTLLSAILGEIPALRGAAQVNGSMAYVPQQAWIFNSTIRENIVFGREFDPDRYQKTIKSSALRRDLSLFPAGDQQELGERGSNISGGQKQRISIARAAYADTDIVLFDDCLSALDARVGRQIFEECIGGTSSSPPFLAGKTRIMVTNQLHFLPAADNVIVINDGAILEAGPYAQLMQNEDGALSELMKDFRGKGDEDDVSDTNEESGKAEDDGDEDVKEKKDAPTKKEISDAKLIQAENREVGSVSSQVYKDYAKAAGGYQIMIFSLFVVAAIEGLRLGASWVLSQWSSDGFGWVVGAYIGLYAGVSIFQSAITVGKSVLFARTGLTASKVLHEGILRGILRAPMEFFDQTPAGRILNRFSKDMSLIDMALAPMLEMLINSVAQLLSTALLVVITLPYTMIVFVPVFVGFYFVQSYYRHTARELKRLDALSRSPVYSGFGEALDGLTTIRAFSAEQQMKTQLRRNLDGNQRMMLAGFCANRWLSLRIEFLGGLIVLAAGVFAVLNRSNLGPEIVGLVLSYAFSITMLLMIITRFFTETEKSFNAVERVVEYTEIEPEALPETPRDPDSSWPSQGAITWSRVSMRYRENLPPVLRSVQIDMKAGEKVGVCGRTGAGKSTLFQSLFRLYEIDDDGGVIKIDGVDTRGIGLTPLRRGIAIIPQEPVLFVGSFRWNLDPFNEHSDQDIWAALSHAYLKDLVEKLPDKLESEITEGGGNMSVGQRQLLCLARAMLAKSRILVVDEATANVDMHTDRLIQTTIRSQFAGCTTLTIAHRLDTIIDSDRILVLDAGEVAEYDTPKALLSPGGGIGSFRALVDGTGPVEAKRLEDVAFGRVAFDDILEDPTAAAAKLSEVNSQTAVKQRLDKSAGLSRENDVFRARDVLRRAIDDAVLARRSGETDDKAWLRQLRLMIDDMQEALEGKDEAVTKLAGQQLTD